MKKKGFLDGYQTYDTSAGFGNKNQWQSAFRQRMGKEDAEKIFKEEPHTPHAILGLAAGATQAEIKKAFRTLITVWHPDKNQHRMEEAEAMSKKIIAAYSLLAD